MNAMLTERRVEELAEGIKQFNDCIKAAHRAFVDALAELLAVKPFLFSLQRRRMQRVLIVTTEPFSLGRGRTGVQTHYRYHNKAAQTPKGARVVPKHVRKRLSAAHQEQLAAGQTVTVVSL